MGWERRGNHSYYYRKEREGSRVKSVYVGRGEIAGLTATLDAMQRNDQKTERIKEQHDLLVCSSFDTEMDAMVQLVTMLTEARLIIAGFHQHKRQWRGRRS